MARILEQKETTTLNSSVGADEGQSSTLNKSIIAHNAAFVTGNNKDSADSPADNFWITRMKNVPHEILKDGKFCCWRNEKRGTKYSKIPYNPKNGEHARSNDPASFSDYQTAVTAAYEQRYSGIGIGIFDGICAIDIDDCLDTNGSPTDMAMDIIKTMHSYTEISPSERGFHILFRTDHFKFDPSKYYIMNHEIGLEVYIAGATSKYVTITGSSCIGIFEFDYGDRSEELQNILDRYMLRETRSTTKPEADPQVSAVNAINAVNSEGIHDHGDDKLLDLIIKSRNGEAFRRLWQGDITGYPSQSEADLLADLEEITQVRLTADDCTSEALTALMAKNKGRIGVVSAEGGIFDILAGRYNNHVNLDIWLKGWSGDMIRVDRLGREAQYIRNPCVSACFAIQPSILSDIMENPVMNGRGLVARFLFSSPPSCIGSRTFFAPSIPADVVSAYRQLVFRLLNTPMMEEARALPLSQEASGIIARHFEENERFLSGSGQVIAEWSNKYIGTILRIAGLMQLAEGTDEMITGPMMQRAIRLGRYYQAHHVSANIQPQNLFCNHGLGIVS